MKQSLTLNEIGIRAAIAFWAVLVVYSAISAS